MLRCPACSSQIDYGDEVEVGQELVCSKCAIHLEVVGTNPVELQSIGEYDFDDEVGEDEQNEGEDSESEEDRES